LSERYIKRPAPQQQQLTLHDESRHAHMTRLRRIAALAVIALAGLPAAAGAAVTCPAQPPLNAWAGSPKTLTIVPCTSSVALPVTYTAALPAPALGTATVPGADNTFIFTGTFNPNGSDPIGADTVNFTADDDGAGANPPVTFAVPISVNAAPVVSTTFTGKDLEPDMALEDGRPTFDVFYKTLVTATSTLTDPTPVAPLAAFTVRFRSGVGAVKTAPTNAAGKAVFTFTPLVSDEYDFGVPALPGTYRDGFVLWVAPDWKIARTFPVKNKKLVISGRLLAGKSVRSKGSYVRFQRRKGTKWVTVISRVPVTSALTFSVKVKRSAYLGKRVRFVYVSKNVDYIGSIYSFTIRAKKPQAHGRASADLGNASRASHR
jgi:hypothetical protein